MTTFDKREDAFENRFAHDEEMEFKARARRNHKLGLWAAQLLGKHGEDAEDYAQSLVSAGVQGGSSEDLVGKLRGDFAAADVAQSEHQIRRRMDELLVAARLDVRDA